MPKDQAIIVCQNKKEAELFTKAIHHQGQFKTLMTFYRSAMLEVETKLKVLNETFAVTHDRNPIETIKCRLKSPKSIVEKLWRKGLPLTVEAIEEGINDIAGVRVICAFPEDVYLLAKYLLKQDDVALVRAKDYIKNPKPSGYRSLHLIVRVPIFLAEEKRMMNVEIQLRTIAMDFWASLEHKMKYKKNLTNTEEIAEELKQCAEEIAALDSMMQNINNKIEKRS